MKVALHVQQIVKLLLQSPLHGFVGVFFLFFFFFFFFWFGTFTVKEDVIPSKVAAWLMLAAGTTSEGAVAIEGDAATLIGPASSGGVCTVGASAGSVPSEGAPVGAALLAS